MFPILDINLCFDQGWKSVHYCLSSTQPWLRNQNLSQSESQTHWKKPTLALCDSTLMVLNSNDLSSLSLSGAHKMRGVQACCINENPTVDDPFAVQMCLGKNYRRLIDHYIIHIISFSSSNNQFYESPISESQFKVFQSVFTFLMWMVILAFLGVLWS